MATANNLYYLTTATSIPNSGLGSEPLTKPAGVQTASIVPDRKYSVYIPSAATFTTSFNFDEPVKTFLMYCKPNVGEVLSVAGVVVEFTGHSYRLENELGEVAEIAATRGVHIVGVTITDQSMSLSVDGTEETIDSNTTSEYGPTEVTVLAAGGLLDKVIATTTPLQGIYKELSDFEVVEFDIENNAFLFDEYREFVDIVPVSGEFSSNLEPVTINLPSSEAQAYKITYSQTGSGGVSVNDEPYESGQLLSGEVGTMVIMGDPHIKISNIIMTKYYSEDIGATGPVEATASGATGLTAPMHQHNDLSAATGVTALFDGSVQILGGWFAEGNGALVPGVTMEDGILTTSLTDVYVNGKPYEGEEIRGSYMMLVRGEFSEDFQIDVPVHSLYASTEDMTDNQIDDAYESFFGNPGTEAPRDHLYLVEHPAMIISTEWDIIGSG